MRGMLVVGLLGGVVLTVWAAPGVPPKPAVTPEVRAAAETYAQQLLYTVDQIATQYVRPVARAELLAAAVDGLHEAVRVPVPERLARDLQHTTDPPRLIHLLADARASLGNPEALRNHQDLLASCRALTKRLDPYSVVATGDELRPRSAAVERHGVGLELADNHGVGPLRIDKVIPGSPAQRAGLSPGDEITHLDGKPTPEVPAAVAQRLLDETGADEEVPLGVMPAARPPLRLAVRCGPNRTPREIVLAREFYRPEAVFGVIRRDDNAWDYYLDRPNRIAQVRIPNLVKGTALRLRETLTELHKAGVRGLILDLRWCPGGYLDEAVNVASLFLGEETVAEVHGRDGQKDTFPSRDGPLKFRDGSVVVLVNGQTRGGAELIAAALQDHRRAQVAGQRTVGKASIQTMLGLAAPESAFKLTTGLFRRPSGKNLHCFADSKPSDDWGVRPDAELEVRTSAELDRRLQTWWERQTLRPGGSTKALPLDDPAADPARWAAYRYLRTRVERAVTSAGR